MPCSIFNWIYPHFIFFFRYSYLANPCLGDWGAVVLEKKNGKSTQTEVKHQCLSAVAGVPGIIPAPYLEIEWWPVGGLTITSRFKQSLSSKYGGVFHCAGMLLCLSGVGGVWREGVNGWHRAIQKTVGQFLISDGVFSEAILGAPCGVVINHRYPQAATGPQLNLKIDPGDKFHAHHPSQ